MRKNRFAAISRALSLPFLTLLATSSLLCQQTAAKPQTTTPARTRAMTLNFGPTDSNSAGRAAAEKLLQALGGPEKVDGVKSLRQTVAAVRQGQHIDLEQTIVYPDEQAQRMHMSEGNMLLVVTPRDAFMVRGSLAENIPQSQRDAMDLTLRHDFINVLQHINDPKYVFVANGQQTVGGVQATVVDVEANGVPTRWWIADDGKLLQERYSDLQSSGTSTQTMTYSDWKSFGGLEYPTKYVLFQGSSKPLMTMTLTAMEVNPEVSQKLFERPASQ